jgi:ribosome assembly protein 1
VNGRVLLTGNFKNRALSKFRICDFGPRRIGPNIIVDSTDLDIRKMYTILIRLLTLSFNASHMLSTGTSTPMSTSGASTPVHLHQASSISARLFEDNLLTGFQLAMQHGPLCAEPLEGVACFLESVHISLPNDESTGLRARIGQYSGHIIGAVRDAVKEGFLQWSPRIMLAVYNVDIQASGITF